MFSQSHEVIPPLSEIAGRYRQSPHQATPMVAFGNLTDPIAIPVAAPVFIL